MGNVKSLSKKDDKRFIWAERNDLIIIPTEKLLKWYKFEKDVIKVD